MSRGRRARFRQSAGRQNRGRGSDRIPMAYQDTPEQIWRKWDAIHGSKTRLPGPLDAIKQCTWVYSAVTFIAEGVADAPLAAWRNGKRVESHPALDLYNRPNNYHDQKTAALFDYAYMLELLLNGAVMRVLGDMQGFRPGTMSVRPRWHFRPSWAMDDNGRQVVTVWHLQHYGASRDYIPQDNIYHDALYNPLHDFEGLAPLTAALLSVANDSSIGEYANRYFENDGSTGIVFSTDHPAFNQKQADDAAKKWKETYAGLRNAFGVKFVGFGLEPYNVGSPLDAKMLQILRQLTREEIVEGIYKLPLDAISNKSDGGDIVIGGPSGGTQASAREGALINVIMPWAARCDAEFTRDIAWRFGGDVQVKHDFTGNPILERRRLERAKATVELIDRGVPLNEVIRWLHLEIEPQPWGDDWWIKNDRLPAQVVLNAGDDAIKIAIPDPVAQERKEAHNEYVTSIVSLAQQRQIAEMVRRDPEVRRAAAGRTNGQRVADILAGGRLC